MTRHFIPAQESFDEWRKDPEYVKAYDALEEEFALYAQKVAAGEGYPGKPQPQSARIRRRS